MNLTAPYRTAASQRSGAALIITLAFVVLLSALVLIYLTQAVNYRLLSNGSLNDFKSATIGQSALETVTGDLIQEIVNGSTSPATTYGTGTNTQTVYTPTTNNYMVPQRTLIGGVAPFPNLIRWSQRSDTIAFPAVGSRASAASSTNAAYYGQYISPDRWNKHYLLPLASPGTTAVSTTPTNTFIAPDWVYVTSQGPTVLTAPTNTVIGRYSYAIYDEGGLLDINVAGYPDQGTGTPMPVNTTHPSPVPTALPMWGAGLKGSEAFADLTQLGLTQAQVDQIVGWRNNLSTQPTGTFAGGYSFSSTSALAYHDNSATNATGFLTNAIIGAAPTTFTDQRFLSRQALIQFFVAESFPQNVLQYLATFTRDIDQPSYNPPVGRPMVQESATANSATFGTGNDAFGSDRTSTTTDSPADINPPWLSERVLTSFSRTNIIGNTTVITPAQVGEPLVKERFPLSRLSLIPVNEGTITASSAQANEIYNYFGLTQVSPGLWTYNHGNSTGIYRLSQVAALTGASAREPDFFELLKAAIEVGSLGKGAAFQGNSSSTYWNKANSAAYLQQQHDIQTQLQILQIGANIIDQSKADDFPTRIQFSGVPAYTVCGVEDLPYLYRFRHWIMRYGTTGSLGAILFQPELWNPHSPESSALVAKTAMPTSFRVRIALDPTCGSTPITPIGVTYQTSPYTDITSSVTFNSGVTPAPLTFNAGEANGYCGFREPTLLAHIGKPLLPYPSNLSTTATTYTDYPAYTPDPNRQITGFLVASFPWIGATGLTTDVAQKLNTTLNGTSSALRYYLEYLDPSGNWITYDNEPFQPYDGATFNMKIVNTSTGYNDVSALALQTIVDSPWGGGGRTDPRTSRWGFGDNGYMNFIPPVTTGPSADASTPAGADTVVWGSYHPDGGISYGDHVGSRADLGFTGGADSYAIGSLYGYRGFQYGYWAENSTRATYQTDSPDNGLRYNLDPDGVPRRAMGGYVTDTLNGGAAASASESLTGLPMAMSNYSSRPTMLHRPFRSVAELGYVFRDTPWGSINFTFPESGDSALLDIFCINPITDPNGLVAGRVNLNTHQAPVLAALLSETLLDKDDSTNPALSQTMSSDLANQLVNRTSNPNSVANYGPLMSRADLVGVWTGSSNATTSGSSLKTAAAAETISPDNFYTGFSYDIGTSNVPSVHNTPTVALIPRQRNAVMRGLVDSGTARTWNLLIDLLAQSGRFPPNTTNLNNFVVDGEKHYWFHVAIDRYTGKILDSQLEVVKE